MKTHIIILNIQRQQVRTKLNVLVCLGNSQKSYEMEVYDKDGILGISFHNELQQYLLKDLHKNKYFIQLVIDFYKGKSIDFPIDLGYF